MIEANFYLFDIKNPSNGYTLSIMDAETGAKLLHTSRHPTSGKELLTARDCLEVIDTYIPQKQEEKGN